MAALAKGLKTNTALTDLWLHKNTISDNGAASLANALMTNTALKALYLVNNVIAEGGALVLADALRTNTALTWLDLENNAVAEDSGSIASIEDSLAENADPTGRAAKEARQANSKDEL